jgi:hypothetical protein
MTHPEKYWHEANEEHCCHPDCAFVGSFESDNDQMCQRYDFYIYDDLHGPEVCLRFGPKAQDYRSPGSLLHFLTNSDHNRLYHKAIDLLAIRGFLTYTLNKETS